MDRGQVLFRLFGKFCPDGTILYTEGSPGTEAYFVQSGRLRLSPAAGVARDLGEGDLLGEEAFFERVPRPARVEARTDARLLQVGEQTLESFCRNGPEAAVRLLASLAERSATARHEREAWALGRALGRSEHLLGELGAGPVARAAFLELGAGPARLLDVLLAAGALAAEGESVRVADRAALDRETARIAAAGGGT